LEEDTEEDNGNNNQIQKEKNITQQLNKIVIIILIKIRNIIPQYINTKDNDKL